MTPPKQRQVQDAWSTLKDVVAESDTKKVDAVKDDMDTLLVFVSMFVPSDFQRLTGVG